MEAERKQKLVDYIKQSHEVALDLQRRQQIEKWAVKVDYTNHIFDIARLIMEFDRIEDEKNKVNLKVVEETKTFDPPIPIDNFTPTTPPDEEETKIEFKVKKPKKSDKIPLKLYCVQAEGESKYREIGYESTELRKWLKSIGKDKAFGDWAGASTGMIIEGKFITYKWDVENFLDGLPNMD